MMRKSCSRARPAGVSAPAMCWTRSSSSVPLTSSAPKCSATDAVSSPRSTQYASTCGKLSRSSARRRSCADCRWAGWSAARAWSCPPGTAARRRSGIRRRHPAGPAGAADGRRARQRLDVAVEHRRVRPEPLPSRPRTSACSPARLRSAQEGEAGAFEYSVEDIIGWQRETARCTSSAATIRLAVRVLERVIGGLHAARPACRSKPSPPPRSTISGGAGRSSPARR